MNKEDKPNDTDANIKKLSRKKKNGEEEKEKQVSDKPNYRIISEQVI